MSDTIQEEEERPVSNKAKSPADELSDAEELDEQRPESEANNLDNEHDNENLDDLVEVKQDQEDVPEQTEQQENEVEEEEQQENNEHGIEKNEDESNKELNDLHEENDAEKLKEDEKQSKENEAAEVEVVHQKLVKRKARNPNKFADGNLIPEEGDEELNMTKSPQPEPNSRTLDDDKFNYSSHRHDQEQTQSPNRMDLTLDEDYQEIEVEIKPTREELIAKYQTSIEERDRLQNANNQLHHKLADYFRKKKSEEQQNQPLFEKSSQEQEHRYLKYLSTIEALKKQLEHEKYQYEKELDDLRTRCEIKQSLVDEERTEYNQMKKDATSRSISVHTGKAPAAKDVEALMLREQQKELEVINVRLENIRLKNQLKKREMELKAKEELGEGLHMIDFEQLKIENQTYNEKIEERNEELMKLKKKINNTVQILTHVKEKLQFVNAENELEKQRLNVYDEEVKKKRDILNRIKQSRDSLRTDNNRLKQNSGLLGNTALLRDFEESVDKTDSLEGRIEHLKRKHAELILNSKGIKQKIAQTKPDHQM